MGAEEGVTIDVLPCEIEYDGPAPVTAFFRREPVPSATVPVIGQQAAGGAEADGASASVTLKAAFRGRGLTATSVPVPSGYTGVVLRHEGGMSSNTLSAVASFDRINVWAHDDRPTITNDNYLKAIAWLAVSDDLHAPI
ncbi:ribonuclease H2, subunit C [Zopfochytrium polystomum]|nr:ribonuclease H2, subunit C [Zopfochytrium polystomum]